MILPVRDPVRLAVDDPSRPGEVRRAAVALAAADGLGEADQGRVALVATEAATNLIKHASGGEIILRSLAHAEGDGVEVLAIDRGPGMADVGRCLQDGFSTAGTAGKGLGALRRMADRFDVVSARGADTVLLARVTARPAAHNRPPAVEIGVVSLPVAGEVECGDGWAVRPVPDGLAVLVVDGLGHGPAAASAARAAVGVFRTAASADPAETLHALHAALRPTRGAAASVAVLDRAAGRVRFAGIGNVSGTVLGPGVRRGMVSLSGTLGHDARKVQVFEYPWPAGAAVVLASDGLATSWDLDKTPGLAARHPAVIAGVLFRDHRRVRDDVTVLVVRYAAHATEGGRPAS